MGANHVHFEKQLRENDVTSHVLTSLKIYSVKVVLIIFIILGRPSQGEYSGLSNVEKCKLHRSKGRELKKKNDAIRKNLWRTKLKKNLMKYEQYKVNERYRKLQNKENKAVEVEEAYQCSSSSDSSFSNKQTLYRSLFRVEHLLPKSPHKKPEVIKKLIEKYHVKIPFNTKHGRPQKDLNEEEKKWFETFLSRNDVIYTNRGRKDHVYVGKIDGECRYKQRLFLL